MLLIARRAQRDADASTASRSFTSGYSSPTGEEASAQRVLRKTITLPNHRHQFFTDRHRLSILPPMTGERPAATQAFEDELATLTPR